MPDLETALKRICEHGDSMIAGGADMLRQLVRDTCDAIGAAEGSILVPSEDQSHLKFLVSINPALDASDATVPIGESVSGYVFSSRQAMAKVNPESVGRARVDKIANNQTEFLLAVPVMDDEGVYGVATFVNRKPGAEKVPFSAGELRLGQRFGEIYATAIKLYRKIEFSAAVAGIEISEHGCEFGLENVTGNSLANKLAEKYRVPALITERSLALPEREREMLLKVSDLLGEYAVSPSVEDEI